MPARPFSRLAVGILLSAITLLFPTTSARAETIVPGLDLRGPLTWHASDSQPIHVTGWCTVWQGGVLTIEPGVTVEFDTGAGIGIGGDYNGYGGPFPGSLIANGTAEQPILFRRSSTATGAWRALYFSTGSGVSGASSSMSHCTIDGLQTTCTGTSQPTMDNCVIQNAPGVALLLNSAFVYGSLTGGSPTLNNVTFQNNTSYDIQRLGGSAGSFTNCTFHTGNHTGVYDVGGVQSVSLHGCTFNSDANAEYAVEVQAGSIDSASISISGYAKGVRIFGGELPRGAGTYRSYSPLGGSQFYHLTGSILTWYSAILRLQPGVVMKGDPGMMIQVGGERPGGASEAIPGYFVAVGTPQDPITMGSMNPAPSNWRGLYFTQGAINSAASPGLAHCVVEGGGNGIRNATVECNLTSQPSMDHCTIRNSSGFGMYLAGSAPTLANVTFQGNASTDIRREGGGAGAFTDCTFYTGNHAGIYDVAGTNLTYFTRCHFETNAGADYALEVPASQIDSASISISGYARGVHLFGNEIPRGDGVYRSFPPLGGSQYYHLSGGILAWFGAMLRLQPGVIMKGDAAAQIQVGGDRPGGATYAIPGYFVAVGTPQAPIIMGSVNPAPNNWRGLYFSQGASTFGAWSRLDYCVVEGGGNGGNHANIECSVTSQPSIEHSAIRNSSGWGVYGGSSAWVSIVNSSITGNASGGAWANVNPVTMTNNWWGDPTGPNDPSPAGGSNAGLGQYVTDNVNYGNWLTSAPCLGGTTISASAGLHGTISPEGVVPVECAAAPMFTFTPDPGYHVASLLVDGAPVTLQSSYTFSNVQSPRTIAVGFAINTYTITASAGLHGTISPDGAVQVDHGSDQAFTITPEAGYQVSELLVDGSPVAPAGSHTFTNVQGPHTISATFASQVTVATITPVSPGLVLSPPHPVVTVPVTLARSATTPVRGVSITFQLAGPVALSGGTGGIVRGDFIPSGSNAVYFVTDNGGGSYTVDQTTLNSPCGSTLTAGTLFSLPLVATAATGTGTVTVTSATLRDCSNGSLESTIGPVANVAVDQVLPTVTVLAPNGGELLVPWTTYDITWSASDDVALTATGVSIDFSTNDGASWTSIASGLANSGTYAWAVPLAPSAQARVRVSAMDVNGNAGSDASDAVFTIAGGPTTTALASAPNPTVFGQGTVLTATVTPAGATGSVQFFDGAASLGTGTLSGGTATLAVSTLATGAHNLTAAYAGDGTYDASTSPVHVHTVNAAATTTTLGSTPNPSEYGQSVTLTANVTATAPGAGTPTGSVQFFDGLTSLGSASLAGGTASLATSTLAGGSHSLTAVYAGDGSFSASTSPAHAHLVNATAGAVTLGTSPNPSVYTEPVTLTATIVPAAATGTVQFFEGLNALGSSPVSGGVATLATSALAPGTYSLTAVYSGDANYTMATSPAASHEVKVRIVASAGAHGSITPLGTVLVSAGGSQAFTFAAEAGYHVDAVIRDGTNLGVVASPYTFTALDANHTLDVQFVVNPPVSAIAGLAAVQVRSGNDGDGTTRVHVSWPATPSGTSVKVYRAPFGSYPEYDDLAGAVPAVPGSYPPSGSWTLAGTVDGTTGTVDDEVATRDFWYYAAYVTDTYGTVSAASNVAGGALNYFLGDVSNGYTPGTGDNVVNGADVSLLGAHYGQSGAAVAACNWLDVGPTTDYSNTARPTTDNKINFEDLMVFALDFNNASAPPATPAIASSGTTRLSIELTPSPSGDVIAGLWWDDSRGLKGASVRLEWDPAVVEPVSFAPGDMADGSRGVAMSPEPGVVDAAALGAADLRGHGLLANVTFHRLAAGDPGVRVASLEARDRTNHSAPVVLDAMQPVLPSVTSFRGAVPNPFRGATTLAFTISREGPVELSLYSVDGRRVKTLVRENSRAGEYQVTWDGRDESGQRTAPGVYYARLATAQGTFQRAMVRVE